MAGVTQAALDRAASDWAARQRATATEAPPPGPDAYRDAIDRHLAVRSKLIGELAEHMASSDDPPRVGLSREGLVIAKIRREEHAVGMMAQALLDSDLSTHALMMERGALSQITVGGVHSTPFDERIRRWQAARPKRVDPLDAAKLQADVEAAFTSALDAAIARRSAVMATLGQEMTAEPPLPRPRTAAYSAAFYARHQRAEQRQQRREDANLPVGRAAAALLGARPDPHPEEAMALRGLSTMVNPGDLHVDVARQVARWRASRPCGPPDEPTKPSRWRRQ